MARRPPRSAAGSQRSDAMTLRIIGGTFRGRRLRYDLDRRTRPMKDRIRQAIFNLIGSEAVHGAIVVDYFAGTGLLALEAISRGAVRGIAIERSPRLALQLRKHCQTLGLSDQLHVVIGDVFRHVDPLPTDRTTPRLVFVCPPYAMFADRTDELLRFIATVVADCPPGSTVIVEFDQSFDATHLPDAGEWSSRCYRPTVIAWRSV